MWRNILDSLAQMVAWPFGFKRHDQIGLVVADEAKVLILQVLSDLDSLLNRIDILEERMIGKEFEYDDRRWSDSNAALKEEIRKFELDLRKSVKKNERADDSSEITWVRYFNLERNVLNLIPNSSLPLYARLLIFRFKRLFGKERLKELNLVRYFGSEANFDKVSTNNDGNDTRHDCRIDKNAADHLRLCLDRLLSQIFVHHMAFLSRELAMSKVADIVLRVLFWAMLTFGALVAFSGGLVTQKCNMEAQKCYAEKNTSAEYVALVRPADPTDNSLQTTRIDADLMGNRIHVELSSNEQIKVDSLSTHEGRLILIVYVIGVMGACVSIFQRMQDEKTLPVHDTNDTIGTVFRIAHGIPGIAFAIASGGVFSVLLYVLFKGGLMQGDFFPDVSKDGYIYKLLVWSFIAGFAERFVPDTLDRIAHSAAKNR